MCYDVKGGSDENRGDSLDARYDWITLNATPAIYHRHCSSMKSDKKYNPVEIFLRFHGQAWNISHERDYSLSKNEVSYMKTLKIWL